MKNKYLYMTLGILAVSGLGYYIWKKNKEENTSSVTGGGNKKCPCYGVKSNDGLGNTKLLYSIACCQKAKS